MDRIVGGITLVLARRDYPYFCVYGEERGSFLQKPKITKGNTMGGRGHSGDSQKKSVRRRHDLLGPGMNASSLNYHFGSGFDLGP